MLFADRAGEKDEGNVRRFSERDFQRGETVELRQREIRQDDVRLPLLERLAELGLALDALPDAGHPRRLELPHGQLGFGRRILQNQ